MRLNDQELLAATKAGRFKDTERLLAEGASPDASYEDGTSAMMLAAQKGHPRVLSLLIKYGANPNAKNADGQTALWKAVLSQHQPCTKVLLDASCNVDEPNAFGKTPLGLASSDGNAMLAEILLDAGADIELCDGHGRTPLCHAALSGNANLVRRLLQRGAKCAPGHSDLDRTRCRDTARAIGFSKTIRPTTPLVCAVLGGNAEIVSILLDADADPNIPGGGGKTPIVLAKEAGFSAIEGILRSAGASG